MGSGSSIAVSCGVGHKRGLDLALLWLWHSLVVTAPIHPLGCEPPCAEDAALKRPKKKIYIYIFLEVNTFSEA